MLEEDFLTLLFPFRRPGIVLFKGIPEQFRLTIEGIPGIFRVFHHGYFLGYQAGNVEDVGVFFFGLPFV